MADSAEGAYSSDDPFHEAVATTGLFLIISAIIALAVAIASWGADETLIAIVAGFAALISFATSIACFKSEATEGAPSEVPA